MPQMVVRGRRDDEPRHARSSVLLRNRDAAIRIDKFSCCLRRAVTRAEDLLERLGAAGERARQIARYPLHPRLARLVMEAVERAAYQLEWQPNLGTEIRHMRERVQASSSGRDLKRGTLGSIIQQAGYTNSEFLELLK